MISIPNLNELIKKLAIEAISEAKPTAIVFGQVTSASPLTIQIDQKLILTSTQLILTNNVRDYTTEMSFDNPAIKNIVKDYTMEDVAGTDYKLTFQSNVKNEVTIYNALIIGDEVMMIQIQGGQRYVVIDKVVNM